VDGARAGGGGAVRMWRREYSDAWVEGEISNFRAPDSGHLYFTLKDGNAQIRVVMFSSKARLLRFRPADGNAGGGAGAGDDL